MLSLPESNSPLREMFAVEDVVNWRNLPTFRQGLDSCRRSIGKDPAVRSAQAVVIRANGEVWLIRVGLHGGWKRLWNFGDPLAAR